MALSAEQIVNKVNYRSNAVFKKAGEAPRSVMRAGHSIYGATVGDGIKRLRKVEAVKLVESWLADGWELANEIVTDVLP